MYTHLLIMSTERGACTGARTRRSAQAGSRLKSLHDSLQYINVCQSLHSPCFSLQSLGAVTDRGIGLCDPKPRAPFKPVRKQVCSKFSSGIHALRKLSKELMTAFYGVIYPHLLELIKNVGGCADANLSIIFNQINK